MGTRDITINQNFDRLLTSALKMKLRILIEPKSEDIFNFTISDKTGKVYVTGTIFKNEVIANIVEPTTKDYRPLQLVNPQTSWLNNILKETGYTFDKRVFPDICREGTVFIELLEKGVNIAVWEEDINGKTFFGLNLISPSRQYEQPYRVEREGESLCYYCNYFGQNLAYKHKAIIMDMKEREKVNSDTLHFLYPPKLEKLFTQNA